MQNSYFPWFSDAAVGAGSAAAVLITLEIPETPYSPGGKSFTALPEGVAECGVRRCETPSGNAVKDFRGKARGGSITNSLFFRGFPTRCNRPSRTAAPKQPRDLPKLPIFTKESPSRRCPPGLAQFSPGLGSSWQRRPAPFPFMSVCRDIGQTP